MKQFLNRLAVLLLCMVILTGCSTYSGQVTLPQEASVTTLSFYIPQMQYKNAFRALVSEFEKEYPGIHINTVVIPDNQWVNLLSAKVAVHDVPDLVWANHRLIQSIGEEHFRILARTDSRSPALPEWYPQLRPEQIHIKALNGILYGLPVDSYKAIGLVCNAELFDRYHLDYPDTWEELHSVCQIFASKGVLPLYASDMDSQTTHTACSILFSQVISSQYWETLLEKQIDWSNCEQMLTVLQDLSGLWEYTNKDRGHCTYESAVGAMADSHTAMYISSESFIPDVRSRNPNVQLVLRPLPYKDCDLTLAGGSEQFSIMKDSRHIHQAQIFLQWMARPENMDFYCQQWEGKPIYAHQQYKLNPRQKALFDEFIVPRHFNIQMDSYLESIRLESLWEAERAILNGECTPQEGLHKWWDDYFNPSD